MVGCKSAVETDIVQSLRQYTSYTSVQALQQIIAPSWVRMDIIATLNSTICVFRLLCCSCCQHPPHLCAFPPTIMPYIAICSRWKSFTVEEMNFNSLENIHSCMIVLCSQTLLHKGIIANSLETFCVYQWSRISHKTSPPRAICNVQYLCWPKINKFLEKLLESYQIRLKQCGQYQGKAVFQIKCFEMAFLEILASANMKGFCRASDL